MAEAERNRLQNLLRFAVDAGSHGSNDDAPSGNTEDRAWLREAVHNYATFAVNPVDCMKKHLSTIHRFLHPTLEEDEHMGISDAYHALSEIQENCEDFDLAGDLHRIGGFDIMIQCLQTPDFKMRELACEILGGSCQNHEYCQKALIEMKVLPILISLIENSAMEDASGDSVRLKAFFALSCLVRGNALGMSCFEESDGFLMITNVLQSDIKRLKLKAIFFIRSICREDPKYAKDFHDCKVEIQIISMLSALVHDWHNNQDTPYDAAVEDILECLLTLITTSEEVKAECSNDSHGLILLLQRLKKWCLSKEYTEECVVRCDKLLDLCCIEDQADDR